MKALIPTGRTPGMIVGSVFVQPQFRRFRIVACDTKAASLYATMQEQFRIICLSCDFAALSLPGAVSYPNFYFIIFRKFC